jgi:hypothetical protein
VPLGQVRSETEALFFLAYLLMYRLHLMKTGYIGLVQPVAGA